MTDEQPTNRWGQQPYPQPATCGFDGCPEAAKFTCTDCGMRTCRDHAFHHDCGGEGDGGPTPSPSERERL